MCTKFYREGVFCTKKKTKQNKKRNERRFLVRPIKKGRHVRSLFLALRFETPRLWEVSRAIYMQFFFTLHRKTFYNIIVTYILYIITVLKCK